MSHSIHAIPAKNLLCSITEHDALVTGTDILNVERFLDETLSDIRRLLLDGDHNVASLVVKALGGVIVSNLLNGVADDLLIIKVSLGGDLAKHHDHAGFGGGFAGDLREGILGQAGVEDSVGHLISDLVYRYI